MIVERSKKNPILQPDSSRAWESEAVFNGSPVRKGFNTYLLYRALSSTYYDNYAEQNINLSTIGIAESTDGVYFKDRKQFIIPEEPWERFGCEDPRVTKLDNKYFIFYTALSKYPYEAEGIKVAVAISKDLQEVDERHLVTPFNAKAMSLFPDKIDGKYWAILTADTDRPPAKIALASFDSVEDIWNQDKWRDWYKNIDSHKLHLECREEDHIEVGAAPVKTKYGWLLFYSYIRNYFSPVPLFTIEAVLLDLENPHKVLSRTKLPLLTPDEYYEKVGMVPNIVFPSGAMIKKGEIYLYYGAADTTCCVAFLKLSELLEKMMTGYQPIPLYRFEDNPIIEPNPEHAWEAFATFNPAALLVDKKVHIVYRAMSHDNTSVMGHAVSSDCATIDKRSDIPIYYPREPFEQKLNPGGNSGCEDPRLTLIGDTIYMLYTAYTGVGSTRVALTTISKKDFVNEEWNWSKPILITPPNNNDKDAVLLPEKVDGKFMFIHRSGNDIDYAFSEDLNFGEGNWLEEHRWINTRRGMWDSLKVGAASPPIKTKKGWVFFYHGVSDDGIYRVGAVLLDLNDPTKILGRTYTPLMEPETEYEKVGVVPNVAFPCGSVLVGGFIYLFYGGADLVVGVAMLKLDDLLESF